MLRRCYDGFGTNTQANFAYGFQSCSEEGSSIVYVYYESETLTIDPLGPLHSNSNQLN